MRDGGLPVLSPISRKPEKTPAEKRAIQDAANLTTLIGWNARLHGAFTIGRYRWDDKWYVQVRNTTGHKIFDEDNEDLSEIIARAAQKIRSMPQWLAIERKMRKKANGE
jgi:hypothetical protein